MLCLPWRGQSTHALFGFLYHHYCIWPGEFRRQGIKTTIAKLPPQKESEYTYLQRLLSIWQMAEMQILRVFKCSQNRRRASQTFSFSSSRSHIVDPTTVFNRIGGADKPVLADKLLGLLEHGRALLRCLMNGFQATLPYKAHDIPQLLRFDFH